MAGLITFFRTSREFLGHARAVALIAAVLFLFLGLDGARAAGYLKYDGVDGESMSAPGASLQLNFEVGEITEVQEVRFEPDLLRVTDYDLDRDGLHVRCVLSPEAPPGELELQCFCVHLLADTGEVEEVSCPVTLQVMGPQVSLDELSPRSMVVTDPSAPLALSISGSGLYPEFVNEATLMARCIVNGEDQDCDIVDEDCDDRAMSFSVSPPNGSWVGGSSLHIEVSHPSGVQFSGDLKLDSSGLADLGGVEVHVGDASADAAIDLGAAGFVHGVSCPFSGGGDAPKVALVGHETAHVVQQKSGVELRSSANGEWVAHVSCPISGNDGSLEPSAEGTIQLSINGETYDFEYEVDLIWPGAEISSFEITDIDGSLKVLPSGKLSPDQGEITLSGYFSGKFLTADNLAGEQVSVRDGQTELQIVSSEFSVEDSESASCKVVVRGWDPTTKRKITGAGELGDEIELSVSCVVAGQRLSSSIGCPVEVVKPQMRALKVVINPLKQGVSCVSGPEGTEWDESSVDCPILIGREFAQEGTEVSVECVISPDLKGSSLAGQEVDVEAGDVELNKRQLQSSLSFDFSSVELPNDSSVASLIFIPVLLHVTIGDAEADVALEVPLTVSEGETEAVLIGLLLPAVQKVRAADTAEFGLTIQFSGENLTDDFMSGVTVEDLVIDEREMTTGADWDYRMSSGADGFTGHVTVLKIAAGGGGDTTDWWLETCGGERKSSFTATCVLTDANGDSQDLECVVPIEWPDATPSYSSLEFRPQGPLSSLDNGEVMCDFVIEGENLPENGGGKFKIEIDGCAVSSANVAGISGGGTELTGTCLVSGITGGKELDKSSPLLMRVSYLDASGQPLLETESELDLSAELSSPPAILIGLLLPAVQKAQIQADGSLSVDFELQQENMKPEDLDRLVWSIESSSDAWSPGEYSPSYRTFQPGQPIYGNITFEGSPGRGNGGGETEIKVKFVVKMIAPPGGGGNGGDSEVEAELVCRIMSIPPAIRGVEIDCPDELQFDDNFHAECPASLVLEVENFTEEMLSSLSVEVSSDVDGATCRWNAGTPMFPSTVTVYTGRLVLDGNLSFECPEEVFSKQDEPHLIAALVAVVIITGLEVEPPSGEGTGGPIRWMAPESMRGVGKVSMQDIHFSSASPLEPVGDGTTTLTLEISGENLDLLRRSGDQWLDADGTVFISPEMFSFSLDGEARGKVSKVESFNVKQGVATEATLELSVSSMGPIKRMGKSTPVLYEGLVDCPGGPFQFDCPLELSDDMAASISPVELTSAMARDVRVADLDGDGQLDVVVTCDVTGNNMMSMNMQFLALSCVIGGEECEPSSSTEMEPGDAEITLKRTFVFPHVLETSGRIAAGEFTFDTTIFATYSVDGQEVSTSTTVEIDPKELDKSSPVLMLSVADGDCDDADDDGVLDVTLRCVISGENLADVSTDDLSVHAIVDGEDVVLEDFELDSSDNELTLRKTFVMPHILESSGRIAGSQFTFDTTIFVTYSPSGQEVSSSCAVLVDPKELDKSSPVLMLAVADGDCDDTDDDGVMDVTLRCVISGENLADVSTDDLSVHAIVDGEDVVLEDFELDSSDNELTLRKTFVMPHILETSGRIAGTQFTFDTTIFVTYSPSGQEVSSSCAVPVDPKELDKSQPTLRSLDITVGDLDGDGLDDLACVVGGEDCDDLDRDSISVSCLLDGQPVDCQWEIVNAHTGGFDLSVFGFNPEEIKASARTMGSNGDVELELVVSLVDPTGGSGGGGGGSVSKTFIMPHVLESKGRITSMSVVGSPVLETMDGELVLDLDIEGENLEDFVSGQKAKAWMVNNFEVHSLDGSCTARVSKVESFSIKQNAAGSSGGGLGSGKVSLQDFHFTKRLDKSTPLLMMLSFTDEDGSTVETEFELKLSESIWKDLDKSSPQLRGFQGGVSVAVGDINNDGTPDIIVSSIVEGEGLASIDPDEIDLRCVVGGEECEPSSTTEMTTGDAEITLKRTFVFPHALETSGGSVSGGVRTFDTTLFATYTVDGQEVSTSTSLEMEARELDKSSTKLQEAVCNGVVGDSDGDGLLDLVVTCELTGENLDLLSSDDFEVELSLEGSTITYTGLEFTSSSSERGALAVFVFEPNEIAAAARAARTGRNPQTGKEIKIAARCVVSLVGDAAGEPVSSDFTIDALDPDDDGDGIPTIDEDYLFISGLDVSSLERDEQGEIVCVLSLDWDSSITEAMLEQLAGLEAVCTFANGEEMRGELDAAACKGMPGEMTMRTNGGVWPGTPAEMKIVLNEVVLPRDAASGLPTGKRQHKPVSVTKPVDKSTPLLFNVLTTNENITEDGDSLRVSFDVKFEGQNCDLSTAVCHLLYEGEDDDCDGTVDDLSYGGGTVHISLLLPAVQKVREAASSTGALPPFTVQFSLLGADGVSTEVLSQELQFAISDEDLALLTSPPGDLDTTSPLTGMYFDSGAVGTLERTDNGLSTIVVLSDPFGEAADGSTTSLVGTSEFFVDSFFDVFVEVEIPGGMRLTGQGIYRPGDDSTEVRVSEADGPDAALLAEIVRSAAGGEVELSVSSRCVLNDGSDQNGGGASTNKSKGTVKFFNETKGFGFVIDADDDPFGDIWPSDVDGFFFADTEIVSLDLRADGLSIPVRCSNGMCRLLDGSEVPISALPDSVLDVLCPDGMCVFGIDAVVLGRMCSSELQAPIRSSELVIELLCPMDDTLDSELRSVNFLECFLTQYSVVSPRDAASGLLTGKRDSASGLPTGKRQHKPMTITKELDKATPKLAEAVCNGSVDAGNNENWMFQGSLRLTGENLDLSGMGQGTGLHIYLVDEDGDETECPVTIDELSSGEATVQIGLLLPAVQKVREAASRSRSKEDVYVWKLRCVMDNPDGSSNEVVVDDAFSMLLSEFRDDDDDGDGGPEDVDAFFFDDIIIGAISQRDRTLVVAFACTAGTDRLADGSVAPAGSTYPFVDWSVDIVPDGSSAPPVSYSFQLPPGTSSHEFEVEFPLDAADASLSRMLSEGKFSCVATQSCVVAPRDAASGLPTGRREPGSGMATGKRQHKPMTITHEIDKSTPIMYRSVGFGSMDASGLLFDGEGFSGVCVVSDPFVVDAEGNQRALSSLSPEESSSVFGDGSVRVFVEMDLPDGQTMTGQGELSPGDTSCTCAMEYMKLGDISGESQRSSSKAGEIEILSWSWGESNAGRDAASGQATGRRDAASGMATGRRTYEPIVIRKRIDKSSPQLMKLSLGTGHVTVLKIAAPGGPDDGEADIRFSFSMVGKRIDQTTPLLYVTDPNTGNQFQCVLDIKTDTEDLLEGSATVHVDRIPFREEFGQQQGGRNERSSGEGRKFNYLDAFPVKWTLPAMDASSGGDVAMEELTLAIESVDFSDSVVADNKHPEGMYFSSISLDKLESSGNKLVGVARLSGPVVVFDDGSESPLDSQHSAGMNVLLGDGSVRMFVEMQLADGVMLAGDADYDGAAGELLCPVESTEAAFDAFLKLDGIDGESEDKEVKSTIEILSWSWGESNAAPRDAASGLATGRREPGSGMATGRRMHKPVKFTMELGRIWSTSGDADDRPTEEISFYYNKIEWVWQDGGITAEDDWESPVARTGGGGTMAMDDWKAPSLRVEFTVEGEGFDPEVFANARLVFNGDTPGAATECISGPITFTKLDAQRTKGETTLGDIVVVRELDKSTNALPFGGTIIFEQSNPIPGVGIVVKRNLGPLNLTIGLPGGTSSGDPIPTDEFSLNFEKIEFVYRNTSSSLQDDGSGRFNISCVIDAEVPQDQELIFMCQLPDGSTVPALVEDMQITDGTTQILIGLLLPAVQKVREAAARGGEFQIQGTVRDAQGVAHTRFDPLVLDLPGGSSSGDVVPVDTISLNFEEIKVTYDVLDKRSGAADDGLQIQCILDQAIPEDSPLRFELELPDGSTVPTTMDDMQITDGTTEILIGLLLPAVQKVREAASRGGAVYVVCYSVNGSDWSSVRRDQLVLDLSADGQIRGKGDKQGDPNANRYDFGTDGSVSPGSGIGQTDVENIDIKYTVQADDHSAGDEHEVEFNISAGAFHDQDSGVSFDDFVAQFEDGRFVLRSGVPMIRSSAGGSDTESSDYEIRADEDDGAVYFIIKMKPVYISSYQTGGSTGDGFDFEGSLLFQGKSSFQVAIKPIRLELAAVSSGGSGGEDRLTENVSLSIPSSSFIVDEQASQAAGSPVGVLSVEFDVEGMTEEQLRGAGWTLGSSNAFAGERVPYYQWELKNVQVSSTSASSGKSRTRGMCEWEPITLTGAVTKSRDFSGDVPFEIVLLSSDGTRVASETIVAKMGRVELALSSPGSGGEPVPMETLSLNFTKIEFEYDPSGRASFSCMATPVDPNADLSFLNEDGEWSLSRSSPEDGFLMLDFGNDKPTLAKPFTLQGEGQLPPDLLQEWETTLASRPQAFDAEVLLIYMPRGGDSGGRKTPFQRSLTIRVNRIEMAAVAPGGGSDNSGGNGLDILIGGLGTDGPAARSISFSDPEYRYVPVRRTSKPLVQGLMTAAVVADGFSEEELRGGEFVLKGKDGKQIQYLKYELKNVLVSSYSVSGNAGDELPRCEGICEWQDIVLTGELMPAEGSTSMDCPWDISFVPGEADRSSSETIVCKMGRVELAIVDNGDGSMGGSDSTNDLASSGGDSGASYGGARATYLKYEMKNVMVTSFNVNASGNAACVVELSEPMCILADGSSVPASEVPEAWDSVHELEVVLTLPDGTEMSGTTFCPVETEILSMDLTGHIVSPSAGREDTMEIYGFSHEVVSPRDAASGLPTGKREPSFGTTSTVTVGRADLSVGEDGQVDALDTDSDNDGVLDLVVLSSSMENWRDTDSDDDGICDVVVDFELDNSSQFAIDSFFDITFQIELPDGAFVDGVVLYQNGDDPLLRKRPGRVKYGDITLKKGYIVDGALQFVMDMDVSYTGNRKDLMDWITETVQGKPWKRTVTVKEILKDGSAGKAVGGSSDNLGSNGQDGVDNGSIGGDLDLMLSSARCENYRDPDDDNDGICDVVVEFELSSELGNPLEPRFTYDSTLQLPDGTSVVGVTEFQDGDDIILRKRPGRTKYSNVTLKRGMMAGNDETHTQFPATAVCVLPDGTEIRKDIVVALSPEDAARFYNKRKFSEAELQERGTDNDGVEDGVEWRLQGNSDSNETGNGSDPQAMIEERKKCFTNQFDVDLIESRSYSTGPFELEFPISDVDGDGAVNDNDARLIAQALADSVHAENAGGEDLSSNFEFDCIVADVKMNPPDMATCRLDISFNPMATGMPNLIAAGKGANESSAISTMRTLVTVQALFRDTDMDGRAASSSQSELMVMITPVVTDVVPEEKERGITINTSHVEYSSVRIDESSSMLVFTDLIIDVEENGVHTTGEGEVAYQQIKFADGSSVPAVVEYRDGDDPLTRKQMGRIKCGDVTLERSAMAGSENAIIAILIGLLKDGTEVQCPVLIPLDDQTAAKVKEFSPAEEQLKGAPRHIVAPDGGGGGTAGGGPHVVVFSGQSGSQSPAPGGPIPIPYPNLSSGEGVVLNFEIDNMPEGADVDSAWETCSGGSLNIEISDSSTGSDQFHTTTPGHKYVDTLTLRGPLTSGRKGMMTWIADTVGKGGSSSGELFVQLTDGTVLSCPLVLQVTETDANADGLPDYLDDDSDGDGIQDYLDDDSDGDGVSDLEEDGGASAQISSVKEQEEGFGNDLDDSSVSTNPPGNGAGSNDIRFIRSRSGHRISFDDTKVDAEMQLAPSGDGGTEMLGLFVVTLIDEGPAGDASVTRTDPYGNFNFRVVINDSSAGGFSDVSGLSTEITPVEYREGADGSSTSSLRAEIRMSSSQQGLSMGQPVKDWIDASLNGGPTGPPPPLSGLVIVSSTGGEGELRIPFSVVPQLEADAQDYNSSRSNNINGSADNGNGGGSDGSGEGTGADELLGVVPQTEGTYIFELSVVDSTGLSSLRLTFEPAAASSANGGVWKTTNGGSSAPASTEGGWRTISGGGLRIADVAQVTVERFAKSKTFQDKTDQDIAALLKGVSGPVLVLDQGSVEDLRCVVLQDSDGSPVALVSVGEPKGSAGVMFNPREYSITRSVAWGGSSADGGGGLDILIGNTGGDRDPVEARPIGMKHGSDQISKSETGGGDGDGGEGDAGNGDSSSVVPQAAGTYMFELVVADSTGLHEGQVTVSGDNAGLSKADSKRALDGIAPGSDSQAAANNRSEHDHIGNFNFKVEIDGASSFSDFDSFFSRINNNPMFQENANNGELPAVLNQSGNADAYLVFEGEADLDSIKYAVSGRGGGASVSGVYSEKASTSIPGEIFDFEWQTVYAWGDDGAIQEQEEGFGNGLENDNGSSNQPAGGVASPDFLSLSLDVVFSSDNKGESLRLSCPWPDATPDASNWWFLPEVDDEVLMAFMEGDPDQPIILGRLQNSVDRPDGGISPQDAPLSARMRVILDRGEAGDNVSNMYVIPAVDTDSFEVCLVISEDESAEGRKYQTISNASKVRHEMAMGSIRNIK